MLLAQTIWMFQSLQVNKIPYEEDIESRPFLGQDYSDMYVYTDKIRPIL
jgi:hypothetical protein